MRSRTRCPAASRARARAGALGLASPVTSPPPDLASQAAVGAAGRRFSGRLQPWWWLARLSFSASAARGLGTPGRRPLTVVNLWVGGRARVLMVLARTTAVWTGGAWRAAFRGVGGGEILPRGNSSQVFSRAAAAASVDVVTFLKAPRWRSSVLLRAPGENPRSADRAVTAFYVVLFLKRPSWSSRWVALWRLDGGVSSACFLRQSLLLGSLSQHFLFGPPCALA